MFFRGYCDIVNAWVSWEEEAKVGYISEVRVEERRSCREARLVDDSKCFLFLHFPGQSYGMKNFLQNILDDGLLVDVPDKNMERSTKTK